MTKTLLLVTAFLSCSGVWAQPPTSAFDLRPVLQPGMNIGGHIFGKETVLYRAAINDAGEIVFSACCDDSNRDMAIFTSRRIVVKQGDVVDARIIVPIRSEGVVAINNAGQVAYEAYFSDTRTVAEGGEPSGRGIFVDNHLALMLTSETLSNSFTLTDDGKVVLQPEDKSTPYTPVAPKRPGLADRIRITPPKLPRFPISIAPNRPQPVRPSANRQSVPDSLSMLRANRFGQVVIPVNLNPDGFVLLLATPVRH
jgi:hypothetical protein